ncbi:MAG: DUF3606 domain-containing protein [Pseudomonadota bacterium]
MPDPRPPFPRAEALRIDLQQGWEAEYWTRKLGVSREELAKVIESAGDRVQQVADYLAEHGAPATSE